MHKEKSTEHGEVAHLSVLSHLNAPTMPSNRPPPSARRMAETLIVRECKNTQIRVMFGDLTKVECDVMVTGANNRLAGREGVDARVHQVAGEELRAACVDIAKEKRAVNQQPCPVGEAVTTEPFGLPTKALVHVVGPDCRRPNQDLQRRELLQQAYDSMFEELAEIPDSKIVATPPLSMDVFAYPHREGARMTMEIVLAWLDGAEDLGIEKMLVITDEMNFINNMKTIYRESEDQFPGVDRTREFRRGLID